MDLKKRKLSETTENGFSSEAALVVTEEDIAPLLDPLSREQLLQLTLKAAVSHADVLSEVRKLADGDPASRKLFVRGLSWTTSSEMLKTEFSRYGAVEEVVVITDKSTGKSKGFGFVTFKHRDAAIRALKEPSKKIEGRMTVCHLSSGAAREASGGVLLQSASAAALPGLQSASAMAIPASARTQVWKELATCRMPIWSGPAYKSKKHIS